jgi:hypothetical protein
MDGVTAKVTGMKTARATKAANVLDEKALRFAPEGFFVDVYENDLQSNSQAAI